MTSTPYRRELGAVADCLAANAAGLRRVTISDADPRPSVLTTVRRDPDLTAEQRLVLKELYTAFREVNRGRARN